MALRRNANTDRDTQERDTSLGRIMQPNGSPTVQQSVAPASALHGMSVGEMAQPMQPPEAPVQQGTPEYDQRFQRNRRFLQSPEIQAGLMQAGLNLMAGGDMGNALGGAMEAAGSVSKNRMDQAELDRKALLDERQQQVSEGHLNIDYQQLELQRRALKLQMMKEGGNKFSRVISGDDPLNERFGLGLNPGERAKVEFLVDANGNLKTASVEGGFGKTAGTGEPDIPQLLADADAAEKAGRFQEAGLLRMQAQTKATGTGGVSAKGGVISPDPNNPTGLKVTAIPGSESDIAAKDAAARAEQQRTSKLQKAEVVTKKIDQAVALLDNSVAPNVFVTGFGEYLSYLPSSTSRDMKNMIATIKANITIDELSKLRAESKTGAAVGNVSNFEDELFGSMLGSLDQGMNAGQMRQNLMDIRIMYDDIVNKGTLSEIGKAVDNGDMTAEDGFKHAAELLTPKGINLTEPMESDIQTGVDEVPLPMPESIPGFSTEQYNRVKNAWKDMPNAQRRSFLGR